MRRGRLAPACPAGRDVLGHRRDPRHPGGDLRRGLAQSRRRSVVLRARADGAHNSVSVADAYVEEHKQVIRGDILAMAFDLERAGPLLQSDQKRIVDILETEAKIRALPAVYIVDSTGGRSRAPSCASMPDRGPVTRGADRRSAEPATSWCWRRSQRERRLGARQAQCLRGRLSAGDARRRSHGARTPARHA